MPEQAPTGLKVAIPATDGFEQSELLEARKALTAAGKKPASCRPSRRATRLEPQHKE